MSKNLNIFIDVSPLRQKNLSGVGNYLKNVLSELLNIDTHNNYFLYSYGYKEIPLKFDISSYKNVCYKNINIPSKLLYISNFLFAWPKTDILKIDGKKIIADVVWLPNLAQVALSRKKTKLITSIHDLSFEKYREFLNFKRRLWHFLMNPRKLIKSSDFLMSVSYNTAYDIENKYKISSQKIFTSHLGVDRSYRKINDLIYLESVKQKHKLPDNFLLFVGTIEPRKNVIGIINAFEKMSYEFENLHLVFCGEMGWKSRDLKNVLSELDFKIRSKIIFLDYLDRVDLPAIYNLAKIFIWPSHYEGFGLPVLEAMACGCVIVTSNNSSMPEVVHDKALLVESFDVNNIYSAIRQLLIDKDLYDYYKNKIIDETYYSNWKLAAEKLLGFFEKRS